eukprot:gene8461-9368_t
MFCYSCAEKLEEHYIYCSNCGTKQDTSHPSFRVLLSDERISEKEAIKGYFYSGLSYEAIVHFLSKYNGIEMSLSTLKRRLSLYNLKRNKKDIDLSDVEGMIRHELDGPGCISGYRGMWHTLCIKYNVHVPRAKAHVYGGSTSNQRIGCWWSSLMRTWLSWWINFFKDLKDQGSLLQNDILHEEALWFCFADIIQTELDFVRLHWNTHYIRRSRHDSVAGKRDELYFLPEKFGARDQLHLVLHDKIEEAKLRCTSSEATNDYQNYFNHVLSQLGRENQIIGKKHWN